MCSTAAATVTGCLTQLFSPKGTHLETWTTDNPFNFKEWCTFIDKYSFIYIPLNLYYPQFNGSLKGMSAPLKVPSARLKSLRVPALQALDETATDTNCFSSTKSHRDVTWSNCKSQCLWPLRPSSHWSPEDSRITHQSPATTKENAWQ